MKEEGIGEETHSRSIFGQFQTVIKSEFRYAVNGILLILSIFIHKHMKQNNLAECKPRNKMRKMNAIGPGIRALLAAPHLCFLKVAPDAWLVLNKKKHISDLSNFDKFNELIFEIFNLIKNRTRRLDGTRNYSLNFSII